jgi:predicted nucleic acid-binding Zn ribbon protein
MSGAALCSPFRICGKLATKESQRKYDVIATGYILISRLIIVLVWLLPKAISSYG